MGYFANGFVFSSEPDFKTVAAKLAGRSLVGYTSNQADLWLIDVWKPRGKLRRHVPFCEAAMEGGQVFYENPVEQWPKEAGNPGEILGFGTWDPLVNVETDFTAVFEHGAIS